MASIYDANTNYSINGIDLRANPGLVTREYLIDVYPSLIDTFRFAGLWTWGYNNNGQLGDNSVTSRSFPVQTIAQSTNWKQTSGGQYHTSAIKTDGTLWLWGYNSNGQLGDNTRVNKSSPVQTISAGTNWKQVSCGEAHTAAIKTDGTLWTWGYNFYGLLGDNTTVAKSSPVQTVSGGTNWKQVACGGFHTAAIKTDGTLWTWGYNFHGQLGDNTVANKSSPVQTVSGGTNWKQVSCGDYYTAAIKTDGTLWLWGQNGYGGLGDNTVANKSSPVQTVSGGTNWKYVACGQYHTAAIKTDGTLWTWGYNFYGLLGDNTVADKSSPVQTVSGGTNWKQVACGIYHTAAIKTDGTLWTWGDNSNGELGDNTVVSRSSPIQTSAGGTNWKQVACGSLHTVTIRNDSEDFIVILPPSVVNVEYLVVAGGGAGGHGGGGAGGYRNSVSGESSGGGALAETPLSVSPGTSYTVTIGAGGTGGSTGTSGSNSVFSTVTSVGGGRGAGYNAGVWYTASVGGSGGGGARDPGLTTGAAGTTNQGRAGGTGGTQAGGGGGASDAGEAGATDGFYDGGDGGNGLSSSITGSAVTRGGGGGGYGSSYAGTGGTGGGGTAGTSFNGTSGTVNTGGGGGGADVTGAGGSIRNGGNGGSGIVILRYPSSYTITLSAGLTGTTSTVGANKVTTITAGTGTVSWS